MRSATGRWGVVLAIGWASCGVGFGQDLKLYVLGKSRKFEQKTPAVPTVESQGGYQLGLITLGFNQGDFSAVSVTPPGMATLNLQEDNGQWELNPELRFDTQAELDAAAPDSASPYQFSFTPGGGGTPLSAPLVLNGGAYPNSPRISNFDAAQRIDADSDFMIIWGAFAGAAAEDFIIFSVGSESGGIVGTPPPPLDGFLAGNATGYLLPSGTLEPGQRYRCELEFYRSSDIRTTDVPGATGRSFYSARTQFDIQTTPVAAPVFGDQVVVPGQLVLLSVEAAGTGELSFQWRKDGSPIPNATSGILTIESAAGNDAGSYDIQVSDSTGQVVSAAVHLEVNAAQQSFIANLSTRSLVLTGSQVMIPGFVISGSGSKRLLVRAVGPTLEDFQVTGFLADPKTDLFQFGTPLGSNDNWNDAVNAAEIRQVTQDVSAFALPEGSRDSSLVSELTAGPYTVKASGVGGTTGIALVELYDADIGGGADLLNISNRGFVGTGANRMIPGFVVSGNSSQTVLIRVVGPGLAQFDVTGFLEDPALRVFRGSDPIAENDDWESFPVHELVGSVSGTAGAFDLESGGKDAAILLTLPPGAYTVQASGVGGTTGVALVEVYVVR